MPCKVYITIYITSFDPNPPSQTLLAKPSTLLPHQSKPLTRCTIHFFPQLRLVHHVGAEDDRVPLRLGARHVAAVGEIRASVNSRINSFLESPFSFKSRVSYFCPTPDYAEYLFAFLVTASGRRSMATSLSSGRT